MQLNCIKIDLTFGLGVASEVEFDFVATIQILAFGSRVVFGFRTGFQFEFQFDFKMIWICIVAQQLNSELKWI